MHRRRCLTLCATFLVVTLTACAEDLNTGLLEAAEHGEHGKVETLLSQGADVNAHGDDYMTPLILAAQNGHT